MNFTCFDFTTICGPPDMRRLESRFQNLFIMSQNDTYIQVSHTSKYVGEKRYESQGIKLFSGFEPLLPPYSSSSLNHKVGVQRKPVLIVKYINYMLSLLLRNYNKKSVGYVVYL
jgi:hypothetical protein